MSGARLALTLALARLVLLRRLRQPHHHGHRHHICYSRAGWPGRPHVLWQVQLPLLLCDDEVHPLLDVSAALLQPFRMLQCLTTFSSLWRSAECIPDHALMVVQGQLHTLAVDFALVFRYFALHLCHLHRP